MSKPKTHKEFWWPLECKERTSPMLSTKITEFSFKIDSSDI